MISERILAYDGRYDWPVQFELHGNGCVEITQWGEGGRVSDQILLTPKQYEALKDFIEHGRHAEVRVPCENEVTG